MSTTKIIVIDDDTAVTDLLAVILRTHGFDVRVTNNSTDGMNLIRDEKFDLVVLDLMMPEMDGFAVMDILRSKPETANIPVIVATAKELTVDEKSRLQGQIQSLMLKGDFLNDEFLEEVRSLIK